RYRTLRGDSGAADQRLRGLEVEPARYGRNQWHAGSGSGHDGNRSMAVGASTLSRAKTASRRGYGAGIAPVIAAIRHFADPDPDVGGSRRLFLARARGPMNLFLLFLLLLKATMTSFSGLSSLPMIHADLVEHHHVLTDRQLAAAVAAGRAAP